MTNQNQSILKADGLVKRYKKRTVVKGVSLEVKQGEVVGLLGKTAPAKLLLFI